MDLHKVWQLYFMQLFPNIQSVTCRRCSLVLATWTYFVSFLCDKLFSFRPCFMPPPSLQQIAAPHPRQITTVHASIASLSFYRPDALPADQPTASKHWRQLHGQYCSVQLLTVIGPRPVAYVLLWIAWFSFTVALWWTVPTDTISIIIIPPNNISWMYAKTNQF